MTPSLTTQGNGYSMTKTMTENLRGKPPKNSHRNQCFFSAFLIPVGIGCCSAKVFMPVTENCSLFTKQNQILPDAEFWCSVEYLLHVNIAIGCVDSVWVSFVCNGAKRPLQRLCSIWINRWKKLPMRWETFFIHSQTFVEHCQRFYNGLSNITNVFKTIINAL